MKGITPLIGLGLLGPVIVGQSGSHPAPLFSTDERKALLAFWNEPGRYAVGTSAETLKNGPWQVRLTPDGSIWLWNYDKARGIAKGAPTEIPGAQNPEQESWEAWIDAKVAHDRWDAAQTASALNAAMGKQTKALEASEPPLPGPIPSGLLTLAGNPPSMAVAVIPLTHTVKFDDGKIVLTDHPPMAPRYAYYRFPQGVMYGGKRIKEMPKEQVDHLFRAAGVEDSEKESMMAVSSLEGGFESVNTYDTGFVSVGFIQFACLTKGTGALGQLLLKYKIDKPEAFVIDFHKFGVDVSPDGEIVVVDPETGAEIRGQSAARKIIDDKRLIAVFQHAGENSEPFRIAQIAACKSQFYPGDNAITVTIDGKAVSGRIADVIKSEAGLATLMDRKVNTGSIEPLTDVLAICAEECGAHSLDDLAKYERDICIALKFRKDFLADASLSQPGPAANASRNYRELASRRAAARNGRKPPGSGGE